MAGEFVEGWLVAQVLGEGSYGEVKLLVNARTGQSVALKTVRTEENGEGPTAAAREAALHRALKHKHVLRCLGERTHGPLHYMFLEYAQGGELFDRIEPDVGMPEQSARRYWRQSLAGLQYLHGRGVAHRDLKPENLLLDSNDNIKISDFGMATVFRHNGKERTLNRVCGTLPYAAPEVLSASTRPYRAAPADLWALAIVLVAMLAGELPWDRASDDSPSFVSWSAGRHTSRVWAKLSTRSLALVAKALRPDPARRFQLDDLVRHPWTVDAGGDVVDHAKDECKWREWCSQPLVGPAAESEVGVALSTADMDDMISFSQPAHSDDMLLATQSDRLTQGSQSVSQRLVRRMTRVWTRGDGGEREALLALQQVLRERRYHHHHLGPNVLAIDCGSGLKMRAWALRAGPSSGEARVLLEFRRSRGCGLEFKRRFLDIKQALRHIEAPPPPHCEDLFTPLVSQEPMDQS